MINMRQAKNETSDMLLVYNLSNDNVVRENSFSTSNIDIREHEEWYKNIITDTNKHLLLLFFDDGNNNRFIGQIKYRKEDKNQKHVRIGISITPEFRGKKLSSLLIMMSIDYLINKWIGITKIIAEIKASNITSIKSFESCGFFIDLFETTPTVITCYKDL